MGELTMFAKRLKEIREKRGLKQIDLAEKLDMSPQTISAYEKAEIAAKVGKNPTLESAIKIAEGLGVSLDWLCGIDNHRAKTYGDVARDLIFAAEVPNNDFSAVSIPMYLDGGPCNEYPAVVISNEILESFFSGWDNVKDLHCKGIIDDELYYLWLDKHISELDEKVIFSGEHASIDNAPALIETIRSE